MKITLLRHAPVSKEFLNRFNGWIDIGIDKEEILRRKKDLDFLLKEKFDNIYSSDLKRCKETLEVLGFENFIALKEFREIAFKDFAEGKSFEEIEKNIKIPKKAFLSTENWIDFIAKESLEDFTKRVKRGIKKLKGDNILICTHKGVMELFLKIYKKRDFFTAKIPYLGIISFNNLLNKN